MNGKKSRYSIARRILIFWCLFIGIGAFFGGTAMLIKPDGSILQMQGMLPYFKKLPFADILFQNYTFPGIALICVNAITNAVAAALLFGKKRAGIICATVFGVTLMLWICIQFYMFPANALSTAYFIFGFLQAVTGYATWVFYNQERFSTDISCYKNIGTNKKELVVYFSRMGYTKRVAYEEADRTGADIFEITTPEPTSGTGGFWWCGFFAMRGKDMPINEITVDLSKYEHITICSPIWIFRLCSPMQAFCKEARGKIKSVSYIILHHTNSMYTGVIRNMDSLLALQHKSSVSLRCRIGKMNDGIVL